MSTQEVAFESEKLIVKSSVKGNHDRCLFVTFCPWSDNPSLANEGFGDKFLEREGIDAFHVVTGQNDWFQSDDILPALEAIKKASAAYKFVVTYGSSMGGYAALNFAPLLNAHRVIALVPQRSLDRSQVPFETRWRAEAERITFAYDFMGEPTRPGCRSFVFFDPFLKLDKLQAQAIRRERDCELVRLPFMGHGTTGVSIGADILKKVIQLVASENDDDLPAIARAMHRLSRKSKAKYYLQIAKLRPRLPGARKLQLILKAATISPDDFVVHSELAKALTSEGRLDEALYVLKVQAGIRSTDAGLFSHLAYLLDKMGRREEALVASEQAIKNAETIAYYWNQNAYLRLCLNDIERAELSQREAVQLDPNVADYHRQLGAILLRAGKVDEAIEAAQQSIHIDRNNAYCWHSYAYILAEGGYLNYAVNAANQAFELAPQNAYYAFFTSTLLERAGALDWALEFSRHATSLAPNDARFSSHLNRLEALAEMEWKTYSDDSSPPEASNSDR